MTRVDSQTELARTVREAPTGGRRARLRILHVISRLGRGGAELGMLKVIRNLGDDEFEHRICCTRGFDPAFVNSELKSETPYNVGSPTPGLQFPLFRLAEVMREYRPEIVHSRNWGALEAIPAAKLAGVPAAIHSEHGYELEMFEGLPLRRRFYRRVAYAMADRVFALSRELRDFHAAQAWMRPSRIGVIYNGVDTQRFTPSMDSRITVRREFGITPECVVLGSVGRLVSIKDHITLLKAARAVAEQGRNIRVLLVGAGPEREKIESYAADALAGKVLFAGDSDRVPALLNAMDVFVLPSLGEGMSNTLLEAMACGLPVVATRVGGNPEVIERDEQGWLFAPGDTERLAAVLLALVDAPQLRGNFGAAARQRVVQAFSLRLMVSSYRELYLEVAARNHAAARRMDAVHVRN